MALVTFVMLEGHRREIDQKQIVHEHRCDGCGEFITGGPPIYLSATIYGPPPKDGNSAPVQLDMHPAPECVDAATAKLTNRILEGVS